MPLGLGTDTFDDSTFQTELVSLSISFDGHSSQHVELSLVQLVLAMLKRVSNAHRYRP